MTSIINILIGNIKFQVIILVLLLFVIYVSSIPNEFIFDDSNLIEKNSFVKKEMSVEHAYRILTKSYRPVRTLINALVYQFSGLDPAGYRLVNIAFHSVNCLLIFALLTIITGRNGISFASVLIFLVHPVNADAVAYISGIRDTSSSMFFLSGFLCYMLYRRRKHYRWLIAAAFSYVIAILCKEMAITLPALCLLFDVCYYYDGKTSLVAAVRRMIRENALFYSSFALIALIGLYYYIIYKHASYLIRTDEIKWWGGSILLNYLTIPKLLAFYIGKILFPSQLISDYSGYPIIARSAGDAFSWTSLIMIGVLAWFSFFSLRINKWIFWGVWWFFLCMLPVLQFLPHHEIMALHYLYLPSVGLIFSICLLVDDLTGRLKAGIRLPAAMAILIAIIVIFTAVTQKRIYFLRSDIVRTVHDLRINSSSQRLHMHLGLFYFNAGLWESAEREYGLALKHAILNRLDTLNNIGVLLAKKHEYRKAAKYLKASAGSGRINIILNYINNLMMIGEKEKARDVLANFARKFPHRISSKVADMMYRIEMNLAEYSDAEKWAEKLCSIQGESEECLMMIARAVMFDHRFRDAESILKKLAERYPGKAAYSIAISKNRENVQIMEELESQTGESRDRAPGRLAMFRISYNMERYAEAVKYLESSDMAIDEQKQNDLEKYIEAKKMAGEIDDNYLRAASRQHERNPGNREYSRRLMDGLLFNLELDRAEKLIPERYDEKNTEMDKYRDVVDRYREKHDLALKRYSKTDNRPEFEIELGKLFLETRNFIAAVAHFENAAEDREYSASAYWLLSRMFFETGDHKKEFEYLRKVISNDPGHVGAHHRLAVFFLKEMGDYEAAIKEFRTFLKLAPESDMKDDARRLLKDLEEYKRIVLTDHIIPPSMEIL